MVTLPGPKMFSSPILIGPVYALMVVPLALKHLDGLSRDAVSLHFRYIFCFVCYFKL